MTTRNTRNTNPTIEVALGIAAIVAALLLALSAVNRAHEGAGAPQGPSHTVPGMPAPPPDPGPAERPAGPAE
jgi:hypothetical protein